MPFEKKVFDNEIFKKMNLCLVLIMFVFFLLVVQIEEKKSERGSV